jgi:hypothetical protein
MPELWFDPNFYAWIPGTAIGIFGGTLGAITGSLASSGKNRRPVTWLMMIFLAFSIILLLAGIVAMLDQQPMAIWASLIGPGILGSVIGFILLTMIRRVYTAIELRRIASMDIGKQNS